MRSLYVIIAFAFSFVAGTLQAAEVDAVVSSRETYVGVPVVLQIRINNASDHEPPSLPKVDGLAFEQAGTPSTRSQTSISIGPGGRQQTTIQSTIYSFRVTPQREGAFTIPPIKVVADGLATITKAVRIVATKSETNDLLFVEVAGKEKEIFVGESLDLTLRIWIRPYRDQEFQITLNEANTWQLISSDSNWGFFKETLQELQKDRQRPKGQQVLRRDSSGTEREYLLYELDATIYPDRPGQIEADDIRLIVNYPLKLGRSRSPFSIFADDDFFRGSGLLDDDFFRGFGSQLGIAKSHPIVAEATIDPITIKPIPQQGRPADYQGAVGQYSIITEARPERVKVGDPVTLHIAIDGTGPMDRVLAPPIASQQNLIKDFKVPDEPLAGLVDRDRKIFTTTIRPRNDQVTQIPPITMSYFDPDREEFVTIASDPIRLDVDAADLLDLGAIATGQPAAIAPSADTTDAPLDPVVGLTLFAGDDLLQSVERPTMFSNGFLIWMIAPPIVALIGLIFSSRHHFSSLVSARRQFEASLTASETFADVGVALEQYLARRFRLAESRLMRDQTVGRLRAAGEHELAIRAERLYANCDKAMYATAGGDSLESLQEEARSIVADLRRRRGYSPRTAGIGKLSSTSMIALFALFSLLPSSPLAAAEKMTTSLTAGQQRQLLSDALAIYASAARQPQTGLPAEAPAGLPAEHAGLPAEHAGLPAEHAGEAREEFARSADKFQLLVDSGVQNDQLYYNLAVARLRAGQAGYAVANLRRALRLRPDNQLYHQTLALAEGRLPQSGDQAGVTVSGVNDVLHRFVSPHVIKGLFVSAWFALWGILTLRLFRFSFHWKSAALLTFACVALTAASYLLRVSEYVRDNTAVLVADDVSVRSGDGQEFAEIAALSDAEGRVVRVLDQRDAWIRIGLASGTTGWIESNACVQI